MFKFEYDFKIKNYTSDVSIIYGKYGNPVSLKRATAAIMLPTKIGIEKMKEIFKLRCEKFNSLSEDQLYFIKSREIKNIDKSIFDFNSEDHFDNLFKSAIEGRNNKNDMLKPYQKYKKQYDDLVEYGVSESAAKKILAESASGKDILEMNNSIYCESINGTPKLIEKIARPGVGALAYHIALEVKRKAQQEQQTGN